MCFVLKFIVAMSKTTLIFNKKQEEKMFNLVSIWTVSFDLPVFANFCFILFLIIFNVFKFLFSREKNFPFWLNTQKNISKLINKRLLYFWYHFLKLLINKNRIKFVIIIRIIGLNTFSIRILMLWSQAELLNFIQITFYYGLFIGQDLLVEFCHDSFSNYKL